MMRRSRMNSSSTRQQQQQGMMLQQLILLFAAVVSGLLTTSIEVVEALYVSYEKPTSYAEGDRIPLFTNKLISSNSLSSVDYSHLSICHKKYDDVVEEDISKWGEAMNALHGDSPRSMEHVFDIRMKENHFCRQLCVASDIDDNNSNNKDNNNQKMMSWKDGITSQLQYQFQIDNMPAAYRYENTERVAIRYWGGIPVGRRGESVDEERDWNVHDIRYEDTSPDDLFIYNHWNIEIMYWTVPKTNQQEKQEYRVVRTTIQPFSIKHDFDKSSSSSSVVPVTQYNPIPSCAYGRTPTYYTSLNTTDPQRISKDNDVDNKVLFTYDVIFTEYKSSNDPFKTRWNVFLRMDDGIPITVQLFGLLVACLINAMLVVVLWTWILRDLSYKPLLHMGQQDSTNALVQQGGNDDDEEEEDYHRGSRGRGGGQRGRDPSGTHYRDDNDNDNNNDDDDMEVEVVAIQQEVQLWPLSTRVFFPPHHAPLTLCVLCGTGAQLLVSSFFFLLFFRLGIINESLGSGIITPAVIFYTLASVIGGYVTARLYAILHGSRKRAIAYGCTATATILPIIGMIVFHLVYDVLPDSTTAPQYNVVSNSVPLILIWLFVIIPLTVLGGWFGFRHGPVQSFPVSEGNKGYQDLALQDNDEDYGDDDDNVHGNGGSGGGGCGNGLWYWKYGGRIAVLFIIGGLLPVACSFVEYAYGVAGPVYVGYFSDNSLFALLSFILFQTCVGAVSCLIFYKQIRSHRYEWWWSTFTTGASSGFYIFLLSVSWLLYDSSQVPNNMVASYALWFAFGSFAISIMAGFFAVMSVSIFSRFLYTFLLRRAQQTEDDMMMMNIQSEVVMESSTSLVSSSRRSLHEPRVE